MPIWFQNNIISFIWIIVMDFHIVIGKNRSLKFSTFIFTYVLNLIIIESAHILFTKEDTVKNVLSQSSKASIQFCATIRVLRWCLEAILLMQRCVLDPNSAQKRARELRHLCAMMNETLLIESHWINLFFHHKWFLFWQSQPFQYFLYKTMLWAL